MPIHKAERVLCLLQLASPALPVGAYSYSEGLETLVDNGVIENKQSLKHWLSQELRYGAILLRGGSDGMSLSVTQVADRGFTGITGHQPGNRNYVSKAGRWGDP